MTSQEVLMEEGQALMKVLVTHIKAATETALRLNNLVNELSTNGSPGTGGEDKTKQRKKREKKTTDPNAPKRPLPGKLVFLNEIKEQMRESRNSKNEPPLPMVEQIEFANKSWENTSEEVKSKYQADFEDKFAVYKRELAEYKSKKSTEGYEPKSPVPESAGSSNTINTPGFISETIPETLPDSLSSSASPNSKRPKHK